VVESQPSKLLVAGPIPVSRSIPKNLSTFAPPQTLPGALGSTPKRGRSKAGSVFEDLGFSPAEAAHLHLRSALMSRLIDEIEARGLTQAEAARQMGITQPRVSDLIRGKLHLFSIDTLVTLLASMGLRVDFKVRKVA
jgi:predicted XRE-type DNA-binding protein